MGTVDCWDNCRNYDALYALWKRLGENNAIPDRPSRGLRVLIHPYCDWGSAFSCDQCTKRFECLYGSPVCFP